jgi:hypothetical protein
MTSKTATMMTEEEIVLKIASGVFRETLQTDGTMPRIVPEELIGTSETTSGIGLRISVTELAEHTGMSETTRKIDGTTPGIEPEELTETQETTSKIDGTTLETAPEMPQIVLKGHTGTSRKTLRTDGMTPRTEQGAPIEMSVMMLKTDGTM